MEVTATQRLDWDQRWNFHPQVSHPIGVEDLVLSLKVCETRTHSQQQSKGPKLKKEANNRTHNQNLMLCGPQRSLLYWLLVLDEAKCKTHSAK